MRWASIDAAKGVSGLAVWDGKDLVDVFDVKGQDWPTWRAALHGLSGVVIESGYVGKNVSTGIVLADARGQIKGFAKAKGVSIWTEMNASRWRSAIGIPGNNRRLAKQAARGVCRWLASDPATRKPGPTDLYLPRAISGDGPLSEDSCEAICIGVAFVLSRLSSRFLT